MNTYTMSPELRADVQDAARGFTPEQQALRGRLDAIRKDKALKPFERRRQIAALILDDLRAHGSFLNTPQGLFYFSARTRRVLPLERESVETHSLLAPYGLNPIESEFTFTLHEQRTEAHRGGRVCEARRLASWDERAGALTVSRFDGQAYRLDGQNIELVGNGEGGVFFTEDPAWDPYTYDPQAARPLVAPLLVDPVPFRPGAVSVRGQRLLFSLLLYSLFFETRMPTKPLALLLGEKGSGKTTAWKLWLKFLFGHRADVSGIERDKEDGFIAAVTSQPFAVFDNVDGRIGWLNDHLARIATGHFIERRELYKTNTLARYPVHCFVGLASRAPTFRRDDVADRLLVFTVAPLTEKRPEGAIEREVLDARDALWSEMLRDLNDIVGVLRADRRPFTSTFRIADFADFAWRVAEAYGQTAEVMGALKQMEKAQAHFALEDDPLLAALDVWVANNARRQVDAATLHRELAPIAEANGLGWPYKSARSLGKRLAHVTPALAHHFAVSRDEDKHLKQRISPVMVQAPIARA